MKKKQYQSRRGKYFMGFLPNEKFLKLTEKERKFYKLYRDNHRWMYEGKEKIEEWKKEIEKIKKKIDEKRFQIEGGLINKRVNKIDGEIDGEKVIGWREKMMEGYSEIGYLSKDYDFFCSVNLRKRESKTLQNQKKGIKGRELYNTSDVWGDKGDRNNPSEDWLEYQKNHKEGKVKEVIKGNVYEKYYIRIEPKGRGWIRNLYVGGKEDVLHLLNSWNSDIKWESKNDKYIRDNLREIYKGYVRFHIHKNGIENIKRGGENPLSQHPLSNVLGWIGEFRNDISEWMDK